ASVGMGDFNHDGNLDLVFSGGKSYLTFGDGKGNFSAPRQIGSIDDIHAHFTSPDLYFSTVVADFDGDGELDLAFADSDTPYTAISLETGTVKFNFLTYIAPANALFYFLTAADFDKDGKDDLVILNYTTEYGPEIIFDLRTFSKVRYLGTAA